MVVVGDSGLLGPGKRWGGVVVTEGRPVVWVV